MMRKTVVTTLAATVVVAGLCGCAPDPFADPTPAPTPSGVVSGFASDEEAFAAAEATYRAYVDAVNERRKDPRSEPDPLSFMTKSGSAEERSAESELRSRGWKIVGDSSIASVTPIFADESSATLNVCLDASGTTVVDGKGNDVTPRERDDRVSVSVHFEVFAGRAHIAGTQTMEVGC
ncbi:MAG: hypothetical protein P0Y48_02960 [Candidatus Microbacterium phytovorans]|uniref:Lipoprotein n=1 Tax=Candidatus Microbacterium phytovorans TaxID=3121374 RepID=A0AAJ5W4B7_9MICO|nr:hypothetical protein [Microbacterium sp.]WEK14993.1 MAG: hypothetical protein P0Y48_02960 [Microbacterium sp.]